MKNTIKLKYGEKLGKLLDRPEELAMLLRVAFGASEETGKAEKENIKISKEALDNLDISGLIQHDKSHIWLTDKSIIDFTFKRIGVKEIELSNTLLSEIDVLDIPKEMLMFYQIAKSFQDMFAANLKAINARTHNIEKATFKKWVDPIRLMVETDGITKDQLIEVWRFLRHHAFWGDKVQSTEKLRKKFDTIYAQIKSDEKRREEGVGGKSIRRDPENSVGVSAEYVRSIRKRLEP